MEEEKQNSENPAKEEKGYEPRPVWQLWAARIGLIVFIGLVILQIVQIYRGFR